MTWVKICGMTNLEDALDAVEAGADAVGFVFYEKSPRCVTVEVAREICSKLPESVEKIGVFVGVNVDPIDTLFKTGLTGIQSYVFSEGMTGNRDHQARGVSIDCLPSRFRSLLAFPMSVFGDDTHQVEQMATDLANRPDGVAIPPNIFDTILLDSGRGHLPGGTGTSFDWMKARSMSEMMRKNGLKLVVAGGLKPENVGEAIEVLRPWGVDVVSGVEAEPGRKDPEKVRTFVRAVREMDGKVG